MDEMTSKEDLPMWLRDWNPKQPVSATDFLSSRIVFYPGSGTDGQPVKFFGSRHVAHCFVFADYGITRGHVLADLGEAGHPFAGYRRVGRTELGQQDLTPNGWTPHFQPENAPSGPFASDGPYAFIEVLERSAGFDEGHGPKRLAILFLCADGVATYDALFCQANAQTPFAVVLQDHGWGGNWTSFGRDGALEQLATKTGRFPELLLVAENTDAWVGYSAVDGSVARGGGVHRFNRQLWRRTCAPSSPAWIETRPAAPPPLPPASEVHQVFELLRDRCTDGPGGPNRFVERCNALLNDTALDTALSASSTWARSWDKPLYANQLAQRATEVAERVRMLFSDPLNLPNDPACLRGLRAPRLKLDRVRLLGQRWADLHRLHKRTAEASLRLLATGGTDAAVNETRRLLGVPGYRTRSTTGTLFDALTGLSGIGPITSLHLLTDLGYPVYKPDRWLVRFAAVDPTCREELRRLLPPGHNLDRLDVASLLRHLDLVCTAVDRLTARFVRCPPPDGISIGGADFRAYRFVDLMVAKFGMKPETSFGLKSSGKDWLLAAPPSAAAGYATLLEIAREMNEQVRARAST